jgi:hypothetical protein
VLYRPVERLRSEFPDAPVATDLDRALQLFEAARRDLDENGG